MSSFPEYDWWVAYQKELNNDEKWSDAAKYFPARIEMRHPDQITTLDTRDGRVVGLTNGPHPMGSDLIIKATKDEWERLVAGETDWFEGNSPGLGKIELEGNIVGAMRNVKAMWLLLGAMKRVGKLSPKKPELSPPPKPSGKETVGRYVWVNGLRTYYEEAGEGPPIVCIHAACQDTLMYRHVLDGLSDDFKVIAIDAPSHAKTLEPPGGEFKSLSQHADFNEAFIKALGLKKPAIIGCSMGGNMVLEMGSRRPDFYSAIISAEGCDYTPTVSDLLLEMLLLNGQQIVECWSQSLTGNRTPLDRKREVVWQIRRVNPEVMAGDLIGYAGFDARDRVGKIRCPVLLLRGDADWLVNQKMVEATKGRISGAEIAVLRGTGHYPMIENPYEFNETVRKFLKKNKIK